jgi:hypothetical protein
MAEKYELPPPSEEVQAHLNTVAGSPALAPAHPRYVRFYLRSVQNMLKSNGGTIDVEPHTAPEYLETFKEYGAHLSSDSKKVIVKGAKRAIFEPVEYVEILTPGDKDTIVNRPVRETDRYYWPEKYVAFKNGTAHNGSDGTPLSACGFLTPERVEELKTLRIYTVEALADVTDGNLPTLGMHARSERTKARDWLAALNGTGAVAELRAQNEALMKRLAALERQAAESAGVPAETPSAAVVESSEKPKAKGPKAKRIAAE